MLNIHKIIEAIEVSCSSLIEQNNFSNSTWTHEIKQSIANVAYANNNNFSICIGGKNIINKDYNEWLYDITIIKMFNEELIEYIDTVIESEWGDIKAILEDFQKVIQSNARNKLMICQNEKMSIQDIFEKLELQVNTFADFSLEDSVTILCYDNANKNFVKKCIKKQQ